MKKMQEELKIEASKCSRIAARSRRSRLSLLLKGMQTYTVTISRFYIMVELL